VKDQIEQAIDQLVEDTEKHYTYNSGTYTLSPRELVVIESAVEKLLQRKNIDMSKARYLVNAAVEELKKKNIFLTLAKVYNAALGQGGWSD